MVSSLELEEMYTSLFDALTEEPQTSEDEQKLLFSLLPRALSRFSFDKSGLLSKALPTLAPFLIGVRDPFLIRCLTRGIRPKIYFFSFRR